jgi:hypothetical protein
MWNIKSGENVTAGLPSPRQQKRLDIGGFVLPVVLLGLVILSVIAATALMSSGDEQRSSRAMRQGSDAFYAAEAGINKESTQLDDYDLGALGPGDSLDLPWVDLGNGASYHATIYRHDGEDGRPELYILQVEGRGRGIAGSSRSISLTLYNNANAGYMLGGCCNSAVTVRGTVGLLNTVTVDGRDAHPPGWESADVCLEELNDRAGLIMDDTTLLTMESGVDMQGDPPLAQVRLEDIDFDEFGGIGWVEIKNRATHIIDASAGQLRLDDGDIYPRYNADGSCDTSHRFNWGSKDPSDPCFNFFPIILVKGEVELARVYGQGVVILDWNEATLTGGEFELEDQDEFNGIILGKGCVEVERNSIFRGAIFTDGQYRNEASCSEDDDFAMGDATTSVTWSQCAVDRAIVNGGLDDVATPTLNGRIQPVGSRAFTELLR